MAKHKVEICGIDTSNIKVLSYEEQTILFKRFKNGDYKAKEVLIYGNLKLVLSILKSYSGRCDNMDDLFQVGCMGLIKAIDNFDLSHNVRFSTYAVPMILGEVKRYLRDNNIIRISRSVKDLSYKILKFKEDYIKEHSKEPTISMIADKFNVTEFDIVSALNSLKDTVSMFEPIYNGDGDVIYLADQLSKEKSMYDDDTIIALREALKNIKEKEKYILVQRYMIGKTQMELSEEIGISQAQISRLEKSGLNHVKKLIR